MASEDANLVSKQIIIMLNLRFHLCFLNNSLGFGAGPHPPFTPGEEAVFLAVC